MLDAMVTARSHLLCQFSVTKEEINAVGDRAGIWIADKAVLSVANKFE
jgi:hypothetical protein